MREIIEKIHGKSSGSFIRRAREYQGFGVGRFKVDTASRFQQSRSFPQQNIEYPKMLNQMHTSDRVHRLVWPWESVLFQIGTLELATGRVFVRCACQIYRKKF
jgi:hypothetical protein